jgi:hypothetical protein
MTPGRSLPSSQEPTTGPCPKPDKYTPHAHTISLQGPF